MFYLYILHSISLEHFYIGCCRDVASRLKKHLSNHKGYTSIAKDWRLVYTESFDTKSEALKREKQLKSWKNKERIRSLIAGSIPAGSTKNQMLRACLYSERGLVRSQEDPLVFKRVAKLIFTTLFLCSN